MAPFKKNCERIVHQGARVREAKNRSTCDQDCVRHAHSHFICVLCTNETKCNNIHQSHKLTGALVFEIVSYDH